MSYIDQVLSVDYQFHQETDTEGQITGIPRDMKVSFENPWK